MKLLLNLILLIVLAGVGYYIYLNVTEDYETLTKIHNMQDQILVELQGYLDGVDQDADELKNEAEEKKRSVGL